MALRDVDGRPLPGLLRGGSVVCIPVYGAMELFERCLDSVLANTNREVPILIADDCSPEPGPWQLLSRLESAGRLDRDVWYSRRSRNMGFVENMNSCFDMTAPADVVMLHSDCEVAERWFDDLRAAAYSDTTVATATPLTNQGALLSVPERNIGRPGLPPGWTLESAAAAIRDTSRRLRPHVPALLTHCAYVKRSALDLVGGFDSAFSPGYGAEVDFSQRCLLRGLAHVVADEVFVLHQGCASFAANAHLLQIQDDHELVIDRRYPYYRDSVQEAASSQFGPLARSISAAAYALRGLSVTVDGSCFGDSLTGTQIHTLELIQALHRSGGVRLRVAVAKLCGPYVNGILAGLDGVEVIDIDRVDHGTPHTNVVHRPYQVGRLHELKRLRRLGDRVVITQQDFIGYRNPEHFDSFAEWHRYRQLARVTFAQAERVVFFSKHAACEAIAEDLVDKQRSRVVYIGVDHYHSRQTQESRPTALPEHVEREGFLLCLGVDFLHKNRLFALGVLEKLQSRHKWWGHLVLAGPQASPGSSAALDHAFLRTHKRVAAATTILGQVTEEEKRWLLTKATLVIFPTTYEGFGLIPFEAAEAGVPCLFAPQASLAEVLPAEAALIEPWDAAVTADRAMALITDPAEADRIVASIRGAAAKYRWDQTARELTEVYREAVEAPALGLIVDLVSELDGRRGHLHLREPTVELEKVFRFWRAYGFLRGSWRGGRLLAGRVRRRLMSGEARGSRGPT